MKSWSNKDDIPLYTWREHLVRCPSQADYFFYSGGNYYFIYLRWRHSDPWTAELVKVGPVLVEDDYKSQEWSTIDDLPLGDYKEEELEELKKDVIEWAKARFRFSSPYKRVSND